MSSEPTMAELAQRYAAGEITTGQYMNARDSWEFNHGPRSAWASGLHSGGGEGCGGAGVGANNG